jgi:hypothetical protein
MNTIEQEIQQGYEELMKRNQATIEWLVKYGFRKESSLIINELRQKGKNK